MAGTPGNTNTTPENQGGVKRELESSDVNEPNKKMKVEETTTVPGAGSTVSGGLALPKTDPKKKAKAKSSSGSSSKKKDKESGSASNMQKQKMDPNKMQDVLFSAGVDIREEEALLHSSIHVSKASQGQNQNAGGSRLPKHPPFLHPDQVAAMMKRVIKEQNFRDTKDIIKNNDVLNMMSAACETYMRDIITNAIVVSRHRRKAVKINSGRRSEVSVALRAIALQQKKDEEKRVKKRIALGLEKEDFQNKVDSEETLHRASNVTAGLRAGSKKQYGWLTSSVAKPTNTGVKSTGRVASDIAARGDSGLKFREAREEPGIVMRDLLNVLENRRLGVHSVISKGYARIRD